MTCIAWDGRTLAADRRSNFGSAPVTTSKIRRVRDGKHLAGASGECGKCRGLVAWYDAGADAAMHVGFGDALLLAIDEQGVAWLYDEGPWPIKVLDEFVAIGSGMAEALVAMACGKTAVEAVDLAARFNTRVGNGVDSLDLGGTRDVRKPFEWVARSAQVWKEAAESLRPATDDILRGASMPNVRRI